MTKEKTILLFFFYPYIVSFVFFSLKNIIFGYNPFVITNILISNSFNYISFQYLSIQLHFVCNLIM